MSTFAHGHSTRERVRRARVWAEFHDTRIARYVQARLQGRAEVEQPGEAWPIIEHAPEHEPDIPPDLLSAVGAVHDAIRRHNEACRYPLRQAARDVGGDPLFPLGRHFRWDRVVLYNSATEMDIRRMLNAEVVVNGKSKRVMKDSRGMVGRMATAAELAAVGLSDWRKAA